MNLQLEQRLFDIRLLLLQMRDLILDLGDRQLQVRGRSLGAAILSEHGADLGQGEAELLALQDHGEAVAVTGIIDASGAFARRREESAVLVESQRSQGHAEFP